MSESKRTDAPWHYIEHNWSDTSIYEGEKHIATLSIRDLADEETQEFFESQMKAYAERIVACVNACEGISTEALNDGVVKDMYEALKSIMDAPAISSRHTNQAQKALAKAEGGAE